MYFNKLSLRKPSEFAKTSDESTKSTTMLNGVFLQWFVCSSLSTLLTSLPLAFSSRKFLAIFVLLSSEKTVNHNRNNGWFLGEPETVIYFAGKCICKNYNFWKTTKYRIQLCNNLISLRDCRTWKWASIYERFLLKMGRSFSHFGPTLHCLKITKKVSFTITLPANARKWNFLTIFKQCDPCYSL